MSPSLKGITLKEGTAVVLDLDGTLVFVESVTDVCAVVVALPEQPPTRNVTPSFTPGRVGGKRISPYASFSTVIPDDQLTPRNQEFCKMFQRWRAEKPEGNAYVDRTPEEIAAAEALANAPTKAQVKEQKAAEKQAAKAAKKAQKIQPRYLQRCQQCNEQPGHPDHGEGEGKHIFVLPAEAPAPATEAAPRKTRVGKRTEGVDGGPYRWVGTPEQLAILAAGNPKYGEGNSGRVIVDFIGETGEAGATLDQIMAELASNPKDLIKRMSADRVQVAIKQLVVGGLIVTVR